MYRINKIIIFFILSLTIVGCSHNIKLPSDRIRSTNAIATYLGMMKQEMKSKQFNIITYQKINNSSNKKVNIYIEGDGLAWMSPTVISSNPTPIRPLPLILSQLDPSNNIIYIGRPCQYHQTNRNIKDKCNQKYWSSHRFSEEVINSITNTISKIKKQYDFQNINLIGFSGGATVALLVAARRSDIKSIRTISGNLDHEKVNKNHRVSQMPNSLNAIDIAEQINHIPQQHLIGGKDKIITKDIIKSYLNASKDYKCIEVINIPQASHEYGWHNSWKIKISNPIKC